MLTAKFDIAKLAASIKKAGKAFGDTNRTAIARVGVQVCRELAVSTQVYGKGGAKKKQQTAIESGINATIATVSEKQFRDLVSGRQNRAKIRNRWVEVEPSRLLRDPDSAMKWIDEHRGAKGHAERMPQDTIGIASKSTMTKVRRLRFLRAGIAKGGFIGAGMAIARHQRGANRIAIGQNFLGYAQKHAERGTARATGSPFKPIAKLINRSRHSGSGYVLSDAEKSKAVGFGFKKTLAWYRHAAKRAIDQS
jgi:hypothetical protein